MYVGMTRAERSLHLSYCRTRKRAGEKVDCAPSRFLPSSRRRTCGTRISRCRRTRR
jgi:superfamily I DNA/RNA helicase